MIITKFDRFILENTENFKPSTEYGKYYFD